MKYRVVIDRPQCVGHARCNSVAPHLFKLDENGYIALDGFDVPEGEEVSAFRGSLACPERVIAMLDENGDKVTRTPRAE